jgi:hypothetical protein
MVMSNKFTPPRVARPAASPSRPLPARITAANLKARRSACEGALRERIDNAFENQATKIQPTLKFRPEVVYRKLTEN